jgi:ABC-2 type transport system permease protein
MMNNIFAIARKELKSYFNSPIAFITIATFLITTSWLFFYYGDTAFFAQQVSDIRGLFQYGSIVILFIAPAISMRLISEEKYNGTLELLVTMPIDDWEIIVGKFLSTLLMFALIITGMLITPITVMAIGEPELGIILTSFFGFFFLGATYLAIGLAASAFTKNQIVAFIITFVLLGVLYLIGGAVSGSGFFAVLLEQISIHNHFTNFFRGIIDLRDIVYFVSIITLSLAVASAALSSRKYVR